MSKTDDDILSVARKRLNAASGTLSDSRTNQVDDLKFYAGSSDNNFQWPDYARTARNANGGVDARPCLTVNKLPQHVRQVTNDQRQNRTSGKVIAANGDASTDVAEVYEGIVRHVEKASHSALAYNTACESITVHGEGYWRITTDYTDEDSFDQDIFIKHIDNPFSVYMDPLMEKPWGEGAEWAFVVMDLRKEEFEHQFPDATPISSLMAEGAGDESLSYWLGEDTIRIAEYFRCEYTTKTLNLYPGNKTAFEGSPEDGVYKKHFGNPLKSRKSDIKTIKWIKMNGYEILDEKEWPGKHIPIVRVVGNEFKIEGQTYLSGIVRNAKDPQRMYNYHCSQEVEMLALSPKAPFIGAAGQFEGFEQKWGSANTKPHPYLEYNPVVADGDDRALPPPQRSQPPMVQSGLIAAKQGASQDIKDATGQYNASLGQEGNERSGLAIKARQHEGDVCTYHYGDNLAHSISYSTRIIIDLVPKIYDRPGRIARIIGEDDSVDMVHLDSTQQSPLTHLKNPNDPTIIKKIYNPDVGKYDVTTATGPGYATKRQEAADGMTQLLQVTPELWHSIGDLVVKNLDWPGAQEIAKRLQKTIDPKLLDNGDADPALQKATQQIQQLNQELQQAHGMLQNVHNSIEAKEMAIKQSEVQIKMYDAQTKRIAATAAAVAGATKDQAIQTPEQIQDVVMGTLHAAVDSGHLMAGSGGLPPMQDPSQGPQQPQEGPPPLDPNKLMAEQSKHVLQANQHEHELAMQANEPAPAAPGGQ